MLWCSNWSDHLGCVHHILEYLDWGSSPPVRFWLTSMQVANGLLLPPTWQTCMEFLAPGFGLVQIWLFWGHLGVPSIPGSKGPLEGKKRNRAWVTSSVFAGCPWHIAPATVLHPRSIIWLQGSTLVGTYCMSCSLNRGSVRFCVLGLQILQCQFLCFVPPVPRVLATSCSSYLSLTSRCLLWFFSLHTC